MYNYNSIIKVDNEDIRKKSTELQLPLTSKDTEVLLLMNEYLKNGYDPKKAQELNIRPGVGLSAVQVDYLKRMFVIYVYDQKNELKNFGVINPKILSESEQMCYLFGGEGCLSVDREIKGLVHRHKRIKVKYLEYNFETKELKPTERYFSDYLAIIFQHECDHLNGVLFYDHIDFKDPFTPKGNAEAIFV